MNKINMVGKTFGRLTVKAETPKLVSGQHVLYCVCSCGGVAFCLGYDLRSGNTKSCGCYQKDMCSDSNTKHGHYTNNKQSPEYHTWASLKRRCNNVNNQDYHLYGGRGITYCKSWEKFENFYADMGKKPEGLSLDRIDNNGNYCKENCRWATNYQQSINKRNTIHLVLGKESKPLLVWCEIYNIGAGKVRQRLRRGWSVEKSLEVKY